MLIFYDSLTEQDLSDIQQLNGRHTANYNNNEELQIEHLHLQPTYRQIRSSPPHTISPPAHRNGSPQQLNHNSIPSNPPTNTPNGRHHTNGIPQQYNTPPSFPATFNTQDLVQQEMDRLKAKLAKYKECKHTKKHLETENHQLKFHIDALQNENLNFRNFQLDVDKRLENSYAREQQLHDLVAMLKEAHR